jgi:hypothetical protein
VPERLRRAAHGKLRAPAETSAEGGVHLAAVAADDAATPRHEPAALADALAAVVGAFPAGPGAAERRT